MASAADVRSRKSFREVPSAATTLCLDRTNGPAAGCGRATSIGALGVNADDISEDIERGDVDGPI